MAELVKAQHLLEEFIARAGDDPEFAEAVARSRERIADIQQIRDFWEQGRREREAAGH
jgi:hypothetical protein